MEIGYIYKYSEKEKLGILVYGHTHAPRWTKPILFTKSNCKSRVSSGQLVFFDLISEKEACNIERASLLNFRLDLIEDISSCYYDKQNKSFWLSKTHILFENLSDIRVIKNADTIINDEDVDLYSGFPSSGEMYYRDYVPLNLPEEIGSLFSLFGVYPHRRKVSDSYMRITMHKLERSTTAIDILDIDNWVDKTMIKKKSFFCDSSEKVLSLFNLFELRRKRAYQDDRQMQKLDYGISKGWKLILSRFSNDELLTIIMNQPLLQPALPRRFCVENIDALSINQAFPLISICEAYYRYRIEKVTNSTEYFLLLNKIDDAIEGKNSHYIMLGVKPYRIKKKTLIELKNLLKDTYKRKLFAYLNEGLSHLSVNDLSIEQVISAHLLNENINELMNLCAFVKKYNDSIKYEKQIISDRNIVNDLMLAFNDLSEIDKSTFRLNMNKRADEILRYIAHALIDNKVSVLRTTLYDLEGFYSENIIDELKEILKDDFVVLDD